MKNVIAAAFGAALVVGSLGGAQAADLPRRGVAPAPVIPVSYSPWMIRGRALVVQPQEDASLYSGPTKLLGADVDISTSVVPELDITYFFTPNIAAELILGVTPHKVKGDGTLTGTKIGEAWLLPPTLTLQYHFTNFGNIKPYVGAGINYTFFFDEKAKGPFTKFDLKDTFGFALQAGVDIMLDQHWGLNFDVKKIFLEPDVKLDNGAVHGKVKIDPWLIGAGVTYRF